MAFGFGGCAVQIPRLSTNPWWITRVMDAAPFKDSEDASSRAQALVASLFDAIVQIPFGLLALGDTLQRMMRVARLHEIS